MNAPNSEDVKEALSGPEIHQKWIASYRTKDHVRFFDAAIDYLVRVLRAPKDARFLDAGCGTCTKSILLAKRGYQVVGADYSDSVLAMAADDVRASGLQDRITLKQETLLGLSFPDNAFDHVLCWGVLMHIPDAEKAIAELARVVRKGGTVTISEGNTRSLQAWLNRHMKRKNANEKVETKRTPVGLESWYATPTGRTFARQMDLRWLIRTCATHDLTLKKHVAAEFAVFSSTRVSSAALRKAMHAFNRAWFRYVRIPGPAYGNILIFEKGSTGQAR